MDGRFGMRQVDCLYDIFHTHTHTYIYIYIYTKQVKVKATPANMLSRLPHFLDDLDNRLIDGDEVGIFKRKKLRI
jgi:hypothetical protein